MRTDFGESLEQLDDRKAVRNSGPWSSSHARLYGNQLIELPHECDPYATVRTCQQGWPLETQSMARREEFLPDEDDDEPGVINPDPETSGSDVFIVEGSQERYGDKTAWSVAARH